MIVQQLRDKDGNNLYSGTILHTTMHGGPFRNEKQDFTTKLLDVRDGGLAEVTYKNPRTKKEYKALQSIGKRREVEVMEKAGNASRGSKFHK